MSEPKSAKKSLRKPASQRKAITGAIILLVAVAAVFGAYEFGRHNHLWGDPDELRAIKSEKLAGPDLLGLELIDTVEMGAGSLVSKTVSPSVSRTFRTPDGEVENTKKKVIELAEKDGWNKVKASDNTDSWRASKKVGGFTLSIVVRKSYQFDNAVEITVL